MGHTHTHTGARAVAVQQALAKRTEQEDDAPMPFRRNTCQVPEGVISPSSSFDENGVNSRSDTPGQHAIQVGHVTRWHSNKLI